MRMDKRPITRGVILVIALAVPVLLFAKYMLLGKRRRST